MWHAQRGTATTHTAPTQTAAKPSCLPTCANSSSFNRPNTSSAVQPLLRVGKAVQQCSGISYAQQPTIKRQLPQPGWRVSTCSTRCTAPQKRTKQLLHMLRRLVMFLHLQHSVHWPTERFKQLLHVLLRLAMCLHL